MHPSPASGTGAASECSSSSSREKGEEEVVGCCIVLLKVLGALLPPPFPSRMPARLYVGNLAVRRQFQRLGYASQMLAAVETLGAHTCLLACPVNCLPPVGVSGCPALSVCRSTLLFCSRFRATALGHFICTSCARHAMCASAHLPACQRFLPVISGTRCYVGHTCRARRECVTVSYTHLTLPTILRV